MIDEKINELESTGLTTKKIYDTRLGNLVGLRELLLEQE